MPQFVDVKRTYRTTRWHLFIGLAGILLVVGMVVFYVFDAVLGASKPVPLGDNVALAGIAGFFFLLGVYLTIFSLRHRLVVAPYEICQRSCFGEKRVRLSDLKSVKWRRQPRGGSVVLRDGIAKLNVEFELYNDGEKKEIIASLHERCDQRIQQGWSQFSEMHLASSPERNRKSRLATKVYGYLFLAIAVLFLGVWLAGLGVQYLVMAVVNVLVGAWLVIGGSKTGPMSSSSATSCQ